MIDLHDSRFIDLLPPNLQDAHAAALSYAVDRQMKALLDFIPIIYMLALVDNAGELVCDQLALCYNIREYSMDMDLDTKRDMIRFGFQICAKKGTRWAVNRLIETIFGFGETEEWFEYDGRPFYFRVRSTNKLATPEDARRFRAAINDTKNVRSWLEDILILRTWGDVLEPFFWEEYQDRSWQEVPDGHIWDDYAPGQWQAIRQKAWGEVSGDTPWAKVLGKHSWADTYGMKTWEHYAGGSWDAIKNLLWEDVLGEKTWGHVYSYIWEETT